ncbi:MAG: hypothetical protein D3905_04160 [Candidatus Electrothrix sp. AS4_5]|nr:hypothetical protein [Candidatus Electrothrix gigas]MCI5188990.1 hypothetical protein [Candidatus Electrothrix gigas]
MSIGHRFRDFFIGEILYYLRKLSERQAEKSDALSQISLMMQYKTHFALQPENPILLNQVGFRAYSQHEEDGILLFLFALLGTKNKICVEICAGDGRECNTANLFLNHRWTGLLFDGDERNVAKANAFYQGHLDARFWPPKVVRAWITRDNINNLILQNGFQGEVDLLSLDVDGNDYWIMEALNAVQPRVIVLEINHLWGVRAAVTVPYADDFVAEFTEWGSDYAGASLPAFVKLCGEKGYRLVGTNAFATNAFFVRNDLPHPWLPEVRAEDCFLHPRAKFGMEKRYPAIENKPWQEV